MNSTAIATISDFRAVQVSKAGKETKFDALGAITDGNKATKWALSQSLLNHYFSNGQFGPLAVNFTRVFGASFAGYANFSGINPETGGAKDKGRKSARQGWIDLYGGLLAVHEEKPFKGAKLRWLDALKNAILTYEAQAAQREAQAAAEKAAADQAAKDAGLLVDVVATEAAPLAITGPDTATDDESATVNADATPQDALM